MKKYIDAQLQVVRINKNDVIATSDTMGVYSTTINNEENVYAPDRFRDWE